MTHEVEEIPWSRITLEEKVGSGSFGEVFQARVPPYGVVAVKRMRAETTTLRSLEELRREASIMARASSENVLTVHAVSRTPAGGIALIVPLMDQSLFDLLGDRNESRLNAQAREAAAFQGALGLRDLHERGVLHRDVKSRNALVSFNLRGGLRLCWADFGLAYTAPDTLRTFSARQMGTLGYMAPELVGRQGEKVGYSEHVDVYAYGVVLAELISGKRADPDPLSPYPYLTQYMESQGWSGDAIDSKVFSDHPRIAKSLTLVGRRCTAQARENRPTFLQVVAMLSDTDQVNNGQQKRPRPWPTAMQQAVDELVRAQENAKRTRSALKVLLTLLSEVNSKVLLTQAGAHTTILRAMNRHADDAGVQEEGCKALGNLAADYNNQGLVLHAGAHTTILRAMIRHANHAGVQQEGCGALGSLACNNDNQVLLSQAYAHVTILRAMDLHADQARVQEYGCLALGNLAVKNGNELLLTQAGAHTTILRAMNRHADDAGVQEEGCRALGSLACNSDNEVLLREADVPNTILRAMDRHADQAEVQEYGCKAIRKLAWDGNNKVLLTKADAQMTILGAMDRHADHAGVQEEGCFALGNLVFNHDNQVGLAQVGAPPMQILKRMAYHDQAGVQGVGCYAPWTFCGSNDTIPMI